MWKAPTVYLNPLFFLPPQSREASIASYPTGASSAFRRLENPRQHDDGRARSQPAPLLSSSRPHGLGISSVPGEVLGHGHKLHPSSPAPGVSGAQTIQRILQLEPRLAIFCKWFFVGIPAGCITEQQLVELPGARRWAEGVTCSHSRVAEWLHH